MSSEPAPAALPPRRARPIGEALTGAVLNTTPVCSAFAHFSARGLALHKGWCLQISPPKKAYCAGLLMSPCRPWPGRPLLERTCRAVRGLHMHMPGFVVRGWGAGAGRRGREQPFQTDDTVGDLCAALPLCGRRANARCCALIPACSTIVAASPACGEGVLASMPRGGRGVVGSGATT